MKDMRARLSLLGTATTLVGIKVLNHIINATILLFVMSAANSDLYIGSRTLYGLAIEGNAPQIFGHVNRWGIPWPALLLCTAFCFLVFLNVHSSGAKGTSIWPMLEPQ
jgi:yeast amino acid transporter